MNSNRKKVAVFGIKTFPAFAGADRVVENIITNMGDDVKFVIYLLATENRIPCSENIQLIYLPSLKGKHLRAFSYFFLCTLHMLFFANYDLVHAHNSDVGLFTCLLKLKYKNKMLGTFHGNPYESAKWGGFAKWYLRISERFFISSCHRLTSVSAMKKVIGRSISYIPNGMEEIKQINFDNYINGSINYNELNIKKGNYLLFVAGRLDKRKGLHHLLNAYKDKSIDSQLVIISDFSHDKAYTEAINSQIGQIGNDNLIVIRKLLPKKDLFDMIINAKMVVFPSEVEAMSMFLLEAIACDTLIVCSDIESNIQIVGTDYKYLFRSGDTVSLSDTIRVALSDIEIKESATIKNKLQAAKAKYDWKKIAMQYSMLYRSLA